MANENNEIPCYEGTEPYIFISYCHNNKTRAMGIIKTLVQHGYRVWYDKGIQGGENWSEKIEERMNKCYAFVALYTKAYRDSDYCKFEMIYAKLHIKERRFFFNCDGTKESKLCWECFSENQVYPKQKHTSDDICKILLKNQQMEKARKTYALIAYTLKYKNNAEWTEDKTAQKAFNSLKKKLVSNSVSVWDYHNTESRFDESYKNDATWFPIVSDCACFVFLATEHSLALNTPAYFKLLVALRNKEVPKVIIGLGVDKSHPAVQNILTLFPNSNTSFYPKAAMKDAVEYITNTTKPKPQAKSNQ